MKYVTLGAWDFFSFFFFCSKINRKILYYGKLCIVNLTGQPFYGFSVIEFMLMENKKNKIKLKRDIKPVEYITFGKIEIPMSKVEIGVKIENRKKI